MKILVTGGAGNIGSHFLKRIHNSEHTLLVIDNLSRGHIEAIPENVLFREIDLLDYENLSKFIHEHKPDGVVHFGGLAYVGESAKYPDLYYTNNVIGSINLISACTQAGVNKFVFYSTCSVYGNTDKIPITEDIIPSPVNPYAQTKLMIENIFRDYEKAFGINTE